jgi:hypothetical protein
LAKWQAASEDMRLAEIRRKQQSKGSNGMLGGLLAGFGAAMAGGNAEMVMGAAMKGVEMTTDNEMSRNVLGGKGDAMVRDGFERRVQEQRTSNAATAASRLSNAASSGAGESSRGAAVTEASAASEKISRVTTNAILLVGIRPTEKNTRNPMCYSTPFRVTYDSSPNKWGDSGRAEAAAMAYRGQFEAACSRHGMIDGMIQPIVEGIQPGYSAHKVSGEDFVVRVP